MRTVDLTEVLQRLTPLSLSRPSHSSPSIYLSLALLSLTLLSISNFPFVYYCAVLQRGRDLHNAFILTCKFA